MPTLVNTDNTIQGQGAIAGLNFTNQATVDANVAGGTLTIEYQYARITNTGTFEATGGGTLYFYGATVNNTNGTISTDSSSSVVINSSAITGGNLTSASGAEIHGIGGSGLDGVTIPFGSTLSVDGPNQVNLTGDLTNNGTVVVGDSGSGDNGNLIIDAPTVTLSGSGTVDLANALTYLEGNGTVPTLLNQGNTIVGPGTVSTYSLKFSDVTTVPPTATTQAASGVTPTAATLNGGVNPHGSATTVSFVYGTDSKLASGTTTTAAQAIGNGTSAVAVTAALTGLQPGTTYYYEFMATSTGGTTDGGPIVSFTTLAPPIATTQAASGVTATAAMLNGSVNPQGSAATVSFVYGTDPTLKASTTTSAAEPIGGWTSAVAVTAALTGLQPGTTYYYEIVATSGGGTVDGSILSFTTVQEAQAPAITSVSSTTFTVGAAGSFTVTATGSPTPSLSETGTLPSGVTFTDNGTATLSGTPAAGTAGTYPLTFTAHNGVGIDATQNFTLTVNKDGSTAAITSSASPSVLNQSVSFTVTVSAAAPGSGTPTGTVQFAIDGTKFGSVVALAGGSATSGSISTLKLGNHTITASYSGDGNFTASVAPSFTQVVNMDNTTSNLVVTKPSVYGQTVSFTATVAPSRRGPARRPVRSLSTTARPRWARARSVAARRRTRPRSSRPARTRSQRSTTATAPSPPARRRP